MTTASALHRIDPEIEVAVPALVEALKDDSRFVREAAADALRKIGPDAKEAVPALINALKYGVPSVRRNAASALRLITYPEGATVEPGAK